MKLAVSAILLTSIGLVLGSKEPVTGASGQSEAIKSHLASSYWLSNKQVMLHYSSQYEVNGELVRTRKYRISAQDEKLYKGTVVQVIKYEFLHESKEKEPFYSAQYLYDVVDEKSITNVAYQAGNDPPEPEKYPGPDLVIPIKKGTSWSGKNLDTVLTDQLKDPVLMTYTFTIDDVNTSISTSAGDFKGCVVVKQIGISDDKVTIKCEDGSTKACEVYVERRRYYCPGYGCIKEKSETHYSSTSGKQGDCIVTSWLSELVEVSSIKRIGA